MSVIRLLRHISKKCEHPSDNIFSILINRGWYVCMILYGKKYYASLRKKYPNHVILYTPTASIGDLCHIKKILPTVLLMNHITKPYLLIAEESVYDMADALDFDLCISASKTELFPLTMMHMLYGDKLKNIFNCFTWEMFYQKYIKAEIVYENLYRKTNAVSDFKLKAGRNVVLAPFEKTVTQLCEDNLPISFWEQLSKYLKGLNCNVYTNCRQNSKEQPIEGTVKLDVPLTLLQGTIINADAVIAVRSGLVDFLCDVPVPQYILYPDNEWLEKFSLKKISENRQLIEIVYHPYLEKMDKLIVYLLNQVKKDVEEDINRHG